MWGKKDSGAKVCRNCYKAEVGVENKTLGYFTGDKKYLTSKCQNIRRHARSTIENSNKERCYVYCKDHILDPILEVHHLKGILEFSEETLIKEINDLSNLIWLCPNDHALLEKELIKLEQ